MLSAVISELMWSLSEELLVARELSTGRGSDRNLRRKSF